MSTLQIRTIEDVVAGKFKTKYCVVDASGQLVGKKSHQTEQEAQAEMDGLKHYARGLDFARAVAPEGATDKGLVGKANIVAQYLLWEEEQSAKADAGARLDAAAEAETEETFDEPAPEVSEEEEF